MATATITLTDICAGGNHLTFTVAVGARSKTRVLLLDHLLGQVTDDELDVAIGVIAKLIRSGRTAAQARTILQTGVSIGQ